MNFKPPVPILRQHTRLFFFALLVVSSSIILAGAYWQHLGIISAVLLSVGTSLLAGTLASIFDKAFGITNTLAEKLARSFTDRGLAAFHTSSRQVEPDTDFPPLDHANSIDLMFNSGRYVMGNHLNDMKEALNSHGCTVRVILSNPDNSFFDDKNVTWGLSPHAADLRQEILTTVNELRDVHGKIANRHSSLVVRMAPCVMTGSFVIVNRRFLRYTPYLPHTHSSDVPLFDLNSFLSDQARKIFTVYVDVFNDVWDKSVEVIGPAATKPH